MHLLILYEELASYTVHCLNCLAQTQQAKILVFTKRINSVAPFEFKNIHQNITIVNREDFTEEKLLSTCKNFNPDSIYLGGWSYKPYIRLIKTLSISNTVIGFDNQYTGSFKQLLGTFYFRMFLKPYLKCAFVPGPQQYEFALKLGYKKENIAQGAYCCDSELFTNYHHKTKVQKQASYPKRFLFVGRYAQEKGIQLLWECFTELQSESPNNWELWCVGKGDISPIDHPKIKHFGFLQPEALTEVIANTGVFVLPSSFEPWGVVLHEYVTAGFPILSTDKVGASTVFLEDGVNGFCIPANNKDALKSKLKNFMAMSDKNLNLMAENSLKIATRITPEKWVQNLLTLYGFQQN